MQNPSRRSPPLDPASYNGELLLQTGRSLGYSKTEKKIGAGERFPPQINF